MKKSRVILLVVLLVTVTVGFFFLPLRQWFIELEGHVQSLGTLGPAVVVAGLRSMHGTLDTGKYHHIGGRDYLRLKDRVYRGCHRRQSRRALFFLAGAYFFARKGRPMGAGEFEVSFPRRSHRPSRFQDGPPDAAESDLPVHFAQLLLGLNGGTHGCLCSGESCSACCRRRFLLVYIGAAARDAIGGPTDASADFYQQILKYVGLLATIAVVVMVTRMARRALREAEQSQEGSAVAGKPRLDPNYKPASFDEMMIAGDSYDQQLIENCHPPRLGQSHTCGKVQSDCHRRRNGRA